MQEGKLPTSMLNGIITLIRKQGDLSLLSNWRPTTLLNTNYKLITSFLTRRIISVLPDFINTDQIYCISNRKIHANLHLIRESLQHDLPLAVKFFEKASANNCVEHSYILHAMEKFDFGKTFVQNIRTCIPKCAETGQD
jgi:hypothetical protein